MPVPEELAPFCSKLTVTGPILDLQGMPSRAEARRRLGVSEPDRYITYAPRGFPFGAAFGRRVLSGLIGGLQRLQREEPGLRLVLTAVPDPSAIQPPGLPPLTEIIGVEVKGLLPASEVRDILAGADLVVVEGTSTLFQAALARTPVLMVPGPIYETQLEGAWVHAHDAGVVVRSPAEARAARMADKLRDALDPDRASERAARLHQLVGTGGAERAVAAILRTIRARLGSTA
jgi:hypothetical protein